jgi:hypothetical protein
MMSNSAGESGGDDNGSDNKKGGKRELSTSKRAAQNRAAQVSHCEIPNHLKAIRNTDVVSTLELK